MIHEVFKAQDTSEYLGGDLILSICGVFQDFLIGLNRLFLLPQGGSY